MELTITESDSDGRRVLRLTGALDLASRDLLLTASTAALESELTDLVLDLSQIEFLDSSGIGAIVAVAGLAEDGGHGFALQTPSDRVTRVLRVAGLLDLWTVTDAPD